MTLAMADAAENGRSAAGRRRYDRKLTEVRINLVRRRICKPGSVPVPEASDDRARRYGPQIRADASCVPKQPRGTKVGTDRRAEHGHQRCRMGSVEHDRRHDGAGEPLAPGHMNGEYHGDISKQGKCQPPQDRGVVGAAEEHPQQCAQHGGV